MALKITGGSLKGRALSGRVLVGVRPTPSMVREALFQILGADLVGSVVLDATGGSGLLTLESISRGAARVVVLERSRATGQGILAAIRHFEVADRVELHIVDALRWDRGVYDVVLADPPYDQDPSPWVRHLVPMARTWMVLEHARRTPAPAHPLRSESPRTRFYGDTALTIYGCSPEGEDGEKVE